MSSTIYISICSFMLTLCPTTTARVLPLSLIIGCSKRGLSSTIMCRNSVHWKLLHVLSIMWRKSYVWKTTLVCTVVLLSFMDLYESVVNLESGPTVYQRTAGKEHKTVRTVSCHVFLMCSKPGFNNADELKNVATLWLPHKKWLMCRETMVITDKDLEWCSLSYLF